MYLKTFWQRGLPNMWTFTIKMLHSNPWGTPVVWLDLFVLRIVTSLRWLIPQHRLPFCELYL